MLTIENHSRAIGRVGAACILLPILVVVAVALLMEGGVVIYVSLFLLCLTVPLAWQGLTVPWVLRARDELTIRFPLWSTRYPWDQVDRVEISVEKAEKPSLFYDRSVRQYRTYQAGVIRLRSGKKIVMHMNDQQRNELRALIHRKQNKANT